MDIGWIRDRISASQYLWTLHADEERRNDGFSISEVEHALLEGRLLENYPADRRGPSCLVCGEVNGLPVHVVCGKNSIEQLVMITVYKPSLPKWVTPTERKKI